MNPYNFVSSHNTTSDDTLYTVHTALGRRLEFRGNLLDNAPLSLSKEQSWGDYAGSAQALEALLNVDERTRPTLVGPRSGPDTSAASATGSVLLEHITSVRCWNNLTGEDPEGNHKKTLRLSVATSKWGLRAGALYYRVWRRGYTLSRAGALYEWQAGTSGWVRRVDNARSRSSLAQELKVLLSGAPDPDLPTLSTSLSVGNALREFCAAALELRGFSSFDCTEVWARFEREHSVPNLLAMLRQPALAPLSLESLVLPRATGTRLRSAQGRRETLFALMGPGFSREFRATAQESQGHLVLAHALRGTLTPGQIEGLVQGLEPQQPHLGLHSFAELRRLRALYPSEAAFVTMLRKTLAGKQKLWRLEDTLRDTLSMHGQLGKPPKPGKGDLQSYHDALTQALEQQQSGLQELHYPEVMHKQLEHSLDDVSFTLARSNFELSEVGRAMGHCVGSYFTRVQSGQSLIVIARGPDGTALACLDIEPLSRRVRQYKLRHNHTPKGAALSLALKYCALAKVKPSSADLQA